MSKIPFDKLCSLDFEIAGMILVRFFSDLRVENSEWAGLCSALLILLFFLTYLVFRISRNRNEEKISFLESEKVLQIEKVHLLKINKQSEIQFIGILENFPFGVFIQVKGKYKFINPMFCEYLAIKDRFGLIDKPVLSFIHSDYHEAVIKRMHFLNDKRIGLTSPLTSRFIRMDGLEVWFETTAVPINFMGQEGALVYVKNISQQRDIELLSESANSISEAVLNSLSASICVLDENGVITTVNSNWRIFGESEKANDQTREGVGMNYLEICRNAIENGDALAQKVLEGITGVMNSEISSFYYEYPCHSDKEKRWFAMNVVPLKKDHTGLVISHSNISEIKLSELERQESQRRFVNAFEHAPIGMAVVSLNGSILKANPAFSLLLGYTNADLMKKGMQDISFIEEHTKELELIKRMKRNELSNSEMDRRFICKSDEIITCRLILSMVLDDQEQPSYFIYQLLDITENVKYLNSIEEQNKVLKEITWMQSHIVRAPLARLMALINALEETEEAEFPHQKVRNEVRNSANELDEIIREISNKAQQVNDLQ